MPSTVDFQLFENGQAVATLTPTDATGNAVPLPTGTPVPAWKSSDPGVIVSPSSDGLSAIVTPANPPVLVTAATLTVLTTLPNGTTITGTSQPIDVVATVDLPTGFKIALT